MQKLYKGVKRIGDALNERISIWVVSTIILTLICSIVFIYIQASNNTLLYPEEHYESLESKLENVILNNQFGDFERLKEDGISQSYNSANDCMTLSIGSVTAEINNFSTSKREYVLNRDKTYFNFIAERCAIYLLIFPLASLVALFLFFALMVSLEFSLKKRLKYIYK